MRSFTVSAGEEPHRVELSCTLLGEDLCLCLGGGRAHIGAAALAVPRQSLRENGENSSSAGVLCMTGHKEDLLARECALRAAARLDRRVVVVAGMHLDNADEEDIRLLQVNSSAALELALARLESEKDTLFPHSAACDGD